MVRWFVCLTSILIIYAVAGIIEADQRKHIMQLKHRRLYVEFYAKLVYEQVKFYIQKHCRILLGTMYSSTYSCMMKKPPGWCGVWSFLL